VRSRAEITRVCECGAYRPVRNAPPAVTRSYEVLVIDDPWKVKPSVGPKFLFCVCVSACTEPSRRIFGGS
jgi:hypothetical protein